MSVRASVRTLLVLALFACDDDSVDGEADVGPVDAFRDVEGQQDASPERDAAPSRDAASHDDAAPDDDAAPEDDAAPVDDAAPELDAEADADADPEEDAAAEDDATPPEMDAAPDDDLGADAEPDAETDADLEADAEPDLGLEVDASPDAEPDAARDLERCDGLDDDGDGRVDEDFDLGGRCEGLGRCGVGFIECGDDGEARCSTSPGGSTDQSRDERCNGDDDDCDGASDEAPEELARPCYTGPADSEGVGVCRGGVRPCVDGRQGVCRDDVTPTPEVCDGEDDDCDGRVDEGLVFEEVCGEGVCREAASPGACIDGVVVPCSPGAPPGDDANCDGLDDDCDGRVDEGYQPVANCGPPGCPAAARPSRCVDGEEIPCAPDEPGEIDGTCDNVDDDCDGVLDEDVPVVERCGLGRCRDQSTPSACVAGESVRCQPGEPDALDAECNGVDDDCDGRVDEDYQPVVECGVGICAINPTPSRCLDGGVVVECRPRNPAPDDTSCDGADDDCDGATDEDWRGQQICGRGVCAANAVPAMCVDGVESACEPGMPEVEVDDDCDGADGDCDGQSDEDVVGVTVETRVTDDPARSLRPRAALDAGGQGFVQVWADGREGDSRIFFQRLDGNAGRIGDAVRVSGLGGDHFLPAVARTADGYGVTWENTRDNALQIYFARLDAQGAVRVDDLRLVETNQNATRSRIAFDGQRFGVVWVDFRDGPPELYLRRLNAAGETVGEETRITDVPGVVTQASIVPRPGGAGWVVAYGEAVDGDVDLWAQLVDADGAPDGPRQRITQGDGNSNDPEITRAGDTYAMTWFDTRDDNAEIYFARLGADGARVGEEIRVTEQLNSSTQPSLTWTGTHFAVAWIDQRGGALNAWFQHLTGEGAPFGAPVRISNSAENTLTPTVLWQGERFGVSYYDLRHGEGEIYFAVGPMGCAPPAP